MHPYVEFQDFLKHMVYNSEKSKLKCQLLLDLVTLHEILGTLYRVLSAGRALVGILRLGGQHILGPTTNIKFGNFQKNRYLLSKS